MARRANAVEGFNGADENRVRPGASTCLEVSRCVAFNSMVVACIMESGEGENLDVALEEEEPKGVEQPELKESLGIKRKREEVCRGGGK